MTIGAGSLSFSTGADQAANIPEGEEGLMLGTWSIKASGENVICTTAKFDIDVTESGNTASASDITNITLYDEDGSAVTGAADGSDDADTETGDGSVSFTDTITFETGSHTYTIKGDLNTVWSENDTIQIGLDVSSAGNWTCKGELTNQPISESPSTNDVDAHKRTVKPGALAIINVATVPITNEYFVKGNEVVVAEVIYSAENSGEDVQIRRLRFLVDSVTSQPDELQSLELRKKEGTVKLGSSTGAEVADGTVLTDDDDSGSEWDATTAGASDTADFDFTGDNTLVIPAGKSLTLEVMATISNNTNADEEFLVANATTTSGATVTGMTSDESITETYTGNGQKFKVSAGGTLTVNISSNSPAAGLMVPGDLKTITVFNLESLYEEITLDKIRLEFTATTTASSSANDIAKVYLTDSAGTIIGNSQGYSINESDILIQGLGSADSKFIVPKNGNKDLYVKAKIDSILVTSTHATSGNKVGFRITSGTDVGAVNSYVVGMSNASSSITADIGEDINVPTGNDLYLRKGFPSVTFYGLAPSGTFDGSGTIAGASNSTKDGYHFKVAADSAGGKIGLFSVVFKVTTTTATTGSMYWYDMTEDSGKRLDSSAARVAASTTGDGSASSTGRIFYVDGSDSDDEVARPIPPSTPHTFRIEITGITEDADATDDNITIIPLGDANQSEQFIDDYGPTTTDGLLTEGHGNDIDGNGHTANFVWSDGSKSAAFATSSAHWYNGYKIPGLDATNTSYQVVYVD